MAKAGPDSINSEVSNKIRRRITECKAQGGTRLDLSELALSQVPWDELADLPHLRSLSLNYNRIGDAGAKAIAERLPGLTSLNLRSNNIGDAGAKTIAARLHGLTSFNLGYNNVGEAGAKAIAARLSGLKSLDLVHNNIGEAGAKAIAERLTGLKSLNLINSNIGEAGAKAIAQGLPGLTSLELGFNNIGEAGARAIAEHLPGLASLNLWGNNIGDAGAKAIAERLADLTTLEFGDNNIGEAGAKAIAERLPGLTSLVLGGNKIGDAGAMAIAEHLRGLTDLNLYSNNIGDAVAKAIAEHLSGLTALNLYINNIGDAGAQALAERLSSLKFLSFGKNNIGDAGAKAIADHLTGLETLVLENNSIGNVGLRHLLDRITTRQVNLRSLYLSANPATLLPKEVLENGDVQAILAAWRSFRDAEGRGELVPLNEAKLLIVGEEAVGKTSLVRFLVNNEPRLQHDRTQGIEKTPWQPEGTPVKTIIWDFAGQEITHGTHQYFLTERSLYLLVLSDRKQDDRSIYRWLPVIAARGEDSPVIVVINQSDEGKEHLVLQWQEIRKNYPSVVAILRTSCNDDDWARKSIAALRKTIVETLNESPALQAVRDKVPTSWMRVKDRIAARASEKMVLIDGDFKSECERTAAAGDPPGDPVTNPDEQRQLLRTLHNLGVVIAHGLKKDDQALPPRLQILDPNWLTQAIYGILQSQHLREKHGCFRKSDLKNWLDQTRYPPRFHDEILSLMQAEEIELAVPLGNKDEYLVPQALPAKEVDWDKYLKGQWLSFAYHYAPLPSGLMARFIVRTFGHSKDAAARTRYGVMLNVYECNVHVGIHEESHVLTIRVAGAEDRRVEALAYARGVVEELNASNNIAPDRRVPLPDKPSVSVSFEHLTKLQNLNGSDHKFMPEGAQREYPVQELLQGIREVDSERFRYREKPVAPMPTIRDVPNLLAQKEPEKPTSDKWLYVSGASGLTATALSYFTDFFGLLSLATPVYPIIASIILGLVAFLATAWVNPIYIYKRLIVVIVGTLVLPRIFDLLPFIEAFLKEILPGFEVKGASEMGWINPVCLVAALGILAFLQVKDKSL